MIYGFHRETEEIAKLSGIDSIFKIPRTGVDTYLKIIFPNTNDWIHDKPIDTIIINNKKCKYRPDYRSESLKLIIEVDGLPHYQKPTIILKDYERTKFYESYGYKVVRIPYFIQLTNDVIKTMFGVDVQVQLFNSNIPSLSYKDECTPAFLCVSGIKRMAEEFLKYPKQLYINIEHLKKEDNDYLTGLSYLIDEIEKIKSVAPI